MIRIIAGTHKGRKIRFPHGLNARPTSDRVKEALFNIINSMFDFQKISVLDLFSGTGNISYEFASRGTELITAVEGNYKSANFLDRTCRDLNMSINVVHMNAYDYLEVCQEKFDLIFADPPYNFNQKSYHQLIRRIEKKELLKPEGSLIIEHEKKTDLSGENLFSENRKYGNSCLSFYNQKADR